VVVPARNEQSHIGGCLAALDLAARVARHSLHIVVVVDSCRDDTARVVMQVAPKLRSSVYVVQVNARRVGTARKTGVESLLRMHDPSCLWLSTTDADSTVPADWFVRQLAYRAEGAGVVVGTVHVDNWHDRGALRPHWESAYVAEHHHLADGHRHVHGANLSFSASAYLHTSGFPDVASDEDVRLVEAFRSAGETIAWANDLSVATSVRRIGRAPHGFASYLNQLAHALDAASAPEASLERTG
jgi:glycosyltransferase involved in cell wall biosynthesis